jgi:hypothetical protein
LLSRSGEETTNFFGERLFRFASILAVSALRKSRFSTASVAWEEMQPDAARLGDYRCSWYTGRLAGGRYMARCGRRRYDWPVLS